MSEVRFSISLYSDLMVLRTSCIIRTTAPLPWLHDWIMWMKPCHWRFPSQRRYTTEMCQDIPRFPNQSDSLYFCDRNFMAQSLTIKTVFSSGFSKASVLALSWLAHLTMWAFHDIIASSAVWNVYMASSLSVLFQNCVVMRNFFISDKLQRSFSHTPQVVYHIWWTTSMNLLINKTSSVPWALPGPCSVTYEKT